MDEWWCPDCQTTSDIPMCHDCGCVIDRSHVMYLEERVQDLERDVAELKKNQHDHTTHATFGHPIDVTRPDRKEGA